MRCRLVAVPHNRKGGEVIATTDHAAPGFIAHPEPDSAGIEAAKHFEPGSKPFAVLAHLLSGRPADAEGMREAYGVTGFPVVIARIQRAGFVLTVHDVQTFKGGSVVDSFKQYSIPRA